MSHENIMRLWNDAVTGGIIRPKFRIITKTSDYTVTPGDFGSVFTTRGATGAVTFTLPAVTSENKNNWAMFINVADYDLIVSGTDGELVVFNDLTASNIGFVTASEKIAGAFLAISDGTSWIVLPIATETQSISLDTSPSSSESATPTSSPSATVSATPSATVSATPSSTPSSSVSSTPSATVSATVSATPSSSPSST